jgi:hypothetical protein
MSNAKLVVIRIEITSWYSKIFWNKNICDVKLVFIGVISILGSGLVVMHKSFHYYDPFQNPLVHDI